jgi:signal transduction histidine kinase
MHGKGVKKYVIVTCISMLIVILFSNWLIIKNVIEEKNAVYGTTPINEVRLKVKDSMDIIKNIVDSHDNDYSLKRKLKKELIKEHMGLAIFNLDQRLIYKFNNFNDDVQSLEESIYMDNSFMAKNKKVYKISLPIIIIGSQKGNAIFYINYKTVYKDREMYSRNIRSIFIGEIIILIFIIFLLYELIKAKIFKPVNNLTEATERINKGDYNFEIVHNEGEVGKLSGAFEFMRTEIYENYKLQKSMEESRKELIAAISHDIRTPVATISAYVEAIKSGVANDEIKLKKYLDIIHMKSAELKKLTEDLFLHSQMDAAKFTINKTEVYFNDFITKLLEPVIIETQNLGMKLEIKTPIPNIIVNIDTTRIGQVFLNIIENSKKYSKQNGRIEIYFEVQESEIKVLIVDDGIGIKPEDMPYIFDKFYRGEKSRNKAYGGAGLGLSICKSIIETHEGRIWIESIDGKETKVFFTIMVVDNY